MTIPDIRPADLSQPCAHPFVGCPCRQPGGLNVTLIKSVDVSSHQTPSLSALGQWIAAGCQLLWVHSYHSGEQAALQASTRAWVATARQAGVWCLPYSWIFGGLDPARQVRESIQLFIDSDMPPKIVALDCETYGSPVTDAGPTAEQILAACVEARSMGVEPILYTGKWWLDGMKGNPEILRGIPAWLANYNGNQDLNVPAPTWVKVIGHQYSSVPVDWSVFDLEALQALAKPTDPCAKIRAELQAIVAKKPFKAPSKKQLAAIIGA